MSVKRNPFTGENALLHPLNRHGGDGKQSGFSYRAVRNVTAAHNYHVALKIFAFVLNFLQYVCRQFVDYLALGSTKDCLPFLYELTVAHKVNLQRDEGGNLKSKVIILDVEIKSKIEALVVT